MGGSGPRGASSGQSTVEFALSAGVLVLLLLGLLDFGRAFYFGVRLQDAAREGARVGVRYDPQSGTHPGLNDTAIAAAVNNVLTNSGMSAATDEDQAPGGATCPATSNGNTLYQPGYKDTAYPTSTGQTYLYICYENTPGLDPPSGTPLTKLNVIVLYRFGLLTGFLQNTLGPSGIEIYGEYQALVQ